MAERNALAPWAVTGRGNALQPDEYLRLLLGTTAPAYQHALGVQRTGPEQFGPVMNDAYGSYTDTGNEQSVPVFSDKEQHQSNAWNYMRQAQDIFEGPGGGHPLTEQYFRDAERAYADSMDDPNIPYNLMAARLKAAGQQGPVDADAIMAAILNRQARGRK